MTNATPCTGCTHGRCSTPEACGIPHDEPDATTFGPDAWVTLILLAISLALLVGGWHALWAAL